MNAWLAGCSTGWPEGWVQDLLGRFSRVIRMGSRDAGLSLGFDDQRAPKLALAGLNIGRGGRRRSTTK